MNREAEWRKTGRRTQAGLTPGKDDNDVWHKADSKDIEWFYQGTVSDRLRVSTAIVSV